MKPYGPKLLLTFSFAYKIGRESFIGFLEHRPERPWNLIRFRNRANTPSGMEPEEKADIAVGMFAEATDLARLVKPGGIAVNVSNRLSEWSGYRARVDEVETGRRVGRHLLDRHFRHFAFVGEERAWFAEDRCAGYQEEIKKAEASFHGRYAASQELEPGERQRALVEQLAPLPRPLGLFCENDERAVVLLREILEAGILVPEEIAVVGVDNDELYCCDSPIMLSSVEMPFREVGRQAAVMAERLLQSDRGVPKQITAGPGSVLVRESSQTFAVEDEAVRDAVAMIYRHLDGGVRVEWLAANMGLSPRTLKDRFVRALGRTPREEISRIRIGEAARMLQESDRTVAEIAGQLGYRQAKELFEPFRSHFGMTPQAFREKVREPLRVAS